jgi:hypothetical protein
MERAIVKLGKRMGKFLPFLTLIILTVWALYIWRHPTHAPVGIYIGILAFVAAIVSILPPDNSRAKAVWCLVFGGFLVLEIATLYQQRNIDRQADIDKKKAEDDRFAGLLKTQQDHFADVLKQNQHDFDATMGEVRGGSGYVSFLALARDSGDLPVMMLNENKGPIRGVDLEIITIPPKGAPDRLEQFAKSTFSPRLVHIGDVSPGFKQAQFTLAPGNYQIRIITRLAVYDEFLEAIRGTAVPGGWSEKSCVIKNGTSEVLKGTCP